MEIGSICLFCYIVWGTPISPTKKRSNWIDVSRYQSNAAHITMTCVAKMSTKVTAGGANLQVLRQGAGFAKRCLMVSIQKKWPVGVMIPNMVENIHMFDQLKPTTSGACIFILYG